MDITTYALLKKYIDNVASGADGESAYELAVKHGFEGSEEEWLKSLEGESGVYVGNDEPTDEDINVWIIPDGESTIVPSFGSTIQAKIGQTVAIKSIDKNGVPTEWMPVDFPASGGGNEWRHIRTVTIPQNITTDTSGVAFAAGSEIGYNFAFDTDKNGEAFELNEIFVLYEARSPKEQIYNSMYVFNSPIPTAEQSQNADYIIVPAVIEPYWYAWGWYNILDWGYRVAIGASYAGGLKHTSCFDNKEKFTALGFSLAGSKSIGFYAGSSFTIYGR